MLAELHMKDLYLSGIQSRVQCMIDPERHSQAPVSTVEDVVGSDWRGLLLDPVG